MGARLMHRRQFLVLGAAGALAPWMSGVAQATQAAQAPGQLVPERLSVGYVNGSDEMDHLKDFPWTVATKQGKILAGTIEVLPAERLITGDQDLAGGDVTMTVHGLYPSAPAACRGVDKVDLDVFFPSPDPASSKPLRFMAWSFRRQPGINVSQRLSFPVPLGLDGRLDLSVRTVYRGEGKDIAARVLQNPPAIQRLYKTSFTVDWEAGRPKLQRGVYLLGVRPALWDSPTELPQTVDRFRAGDLCSLVVSIEPITPE
jgi:hypothetical protein